MLQAVYSDDKLRHMWRSFDFNFSQPSVVLVRVGIVWSTPLYLTTVSPKAMSYPA